jgi:hypothetical protein
VQHTKRTAFFANDRDSCVGPQPLPLRVTDISDDPGVPFTVSPGPAEEGSWPHRCALYSDWSIMILSAL